MATRKATRPAPTLLTCERALANAFRLLEFAEDETDLAKMDRLIATADSWLGAATLLNERGQ